MVGSKVSLPDPARRDGAPPLDELRALIAYYAGRPGRAVDGVMLSSVEEPGPPSSSVADPVLAVVAQGAKRLTVGDRVHDYGAGQYLVVSVGLPVTGHYTRATRERPFLAFGLTLRPAAIASLLLEAGPAAHAERDSAADGPGGRGPRTPPGIAVGDVGADLLDAVVRMIRLLGRPADVPVLAPMAEREILWRLVTGPQGAAVRQIGLADSRLSHIGRAIRALRDRFAESVRVDELARMCGMSASAFHRHFRAVTAMTPIQFQKNIRLREARLLLIGGPRDVASVGFAVGYDSPSQFSREYRRQFGIPPGQDAVRLRELAAAPEAAAVPL
ncbi:AraC family transcriptional regulator [Streptomyces sp. 8L]|uniref:AraC family transcriptional regulator n=1 Tax=Streptomyces sp. 8L TaxID=2877242 RepID=UPI001CD81838|nr:AraC family transcriptional regulator [Streptomyces sp. 8L]MCA1218351.1 AraC family transcriptional regulator [Streptomyces sp. 8L]